MVHLHLKLEAVKESSLGYTMHLVHSIRVREKNIMSKERETKVDILVY